MQSFTGLDNPSSTGIMSFIHPLTALSFNTAALPSDLALESADALSTYRALVRSSRFLPEVDTAPLDPVTFFLSSAILTQKDLLRYEAALKDTLKPLLATSYAQDSDTGLRSVINCLTAPTLAAVNINTLNTPPDGMLLRTGLVYLLSDLKSTGDLVRNRSL